MGYTVIKDGYRNCIICKNNLSVDDFQKYKYTTKQGKRSERYSSRCKTCESIIRKERYFGNREHELKMMRKYKVNNKDALREQSLEYRRNNIEKVRKQRVISEQKRRALGFNSNHKDIKADINRALEDARFCDGYLDVYTNKIIQNPTIDHIIPISKGGDSTYNNFCVTSAENNSSKSNKSLISWMVQRASY